MIDSQITNKFYIVIKIVNIGRNSIIRRNKTHTPGSSSNDGGGPFSSMFSALSGVGGKDEAFVLGPAAFTVI